MVILIVVAAAVLGLLATFVVEARSTRRNRRIAQTSTESSRGPRTDGMSSPIAAEGVMRGGYPPGQGFGQ